MESAQKVLTRVEPSLTQAKPIDTSKQQISPSASASCPECRDSGLIPAGNRLRLCPCRRGRILRSTLPERYQNAKIEDFPQEIYQPVMNWIECPTDGLFLCGCTGTGKTYMAAAIVREQVETGKRVLFKRATDFYSAIRKSYKTTDMNEEDVMREYVQAPLLVLDDLGAGSLSDHERRYTLELLDKRLDARRPTVITTNWTIEQIGERMDERIASRLGGFVVIAFTGKDQRVARKVTEKTQNETLVLPPSGRQR